MTREASKGQVLKGAGGRQCERAAQSSGRRMLPLNLEVTLPSRQRMTHGESAVRVCGKKAPIVKESESFRCRSRLSSAS